MGAFGCGMSRQNESYDRDSRRENGRKARVEDPAGGFEGTPFGRREVVGVGMRRPRWRLEAGGRFLEASRRSDRNESGQQKVRRHSKMRRRHPRQNFQKRVVPK